jgi:hypothetical protein
VVHSPGVEVVVGVSLALVLVAHERGSFVWLARAKEPGVFDIVIATGRRSMLVADGSALGGLLAGVLGGNRSKCMIAYFVLEVGSWDEVGMLWGADDGFQAV